MKTPNNYVKRFFPSASFPRNIVPAIFIFASTLSAQPSGEKLLQNMQWRSIGPANFSGRIVDVEAVENDFRQVYAASASGGVWKSVNAGTTWEPIFNHYNSASIGDLKIFQKKPDIIWVGAGEANNRNSVAWGDGVYKSTDGGKSFEHMGLSDTYQIARIVTHPEDENIAYVAAIGYLWGYIGERGLFKTVDGGKTWQKLANGLPDDGKTGAIDLAIDPSDPNTLYVAFYQRLRKPWRFDGGGPNGGIFKTADGGETWKKLTNGLPRGDTGRIGLDIHRGNPKIIVAIIEHGFQPKIYEKGYDDMSKPGTGIYRSEDGGESWKFINRYNNRPFYYSQIRINPIHDQRVYVLSTTIQISDDGGKTFRPGGLEFEGGLDYHAMWIDPKDGDRYYLGKDKGLTLTHDHGKTFQLFDNIPVGQFYAIGVDMRDPYYVYGGTQDNGTWGGPSFSKDVRGILTDSWWKLHWGDGMFIQIDPTDWRKGYTEAENGSFRRYNVATRRVEFTRPGAGNIVNIEQYFGGAVRQTNGAETLSAKARLAAFAKVLRDRLRFNWRSPMVMSKHNPSTLYLCGSQVLKTVDGGYHWEIISPDLSTNDPVKTDRESGGLTRDVTGAETHCAVTAFSESPLNPAVLWAGTDDGNVRITQNGGAAWIDVRKNIKGVPKGIWVSHVEASHHRPGTAYLTLDGHRGAELSTWIFKTGNFGKTWTRISNNLPDGQVMYVIREDARNPNLLFAGSEFACFVTLDGGESWSRAMNNMPTVAVHDLVIHPRDADLIAGTHGRGLYILDDLTPLQQLNDKVLASDAHIFDNRPMTIWEDASRGGVRGHMFFAGENPPYIPKREDIVRAKLISGGLIHYYLKADAASAAVFEISDIAGKFKRVLHGEKTAGIHRLPWDLHFEAPESERQRLAAQVGGVFDRLLALPNLSQAHKAWIEERKTEFQNASTDEARRAPLLALLERYRNERSLRRIFRAGVTGFVFGGGFRGPQAAPGEYIVKMTVDGETRTNTITVRADPMVD